MDHEKKKHTTPLLYEMGVSRNNKKNLERDDPQFVHDRFHLVNMSSTDGGDVESKVDIPLTC